MKSGTAIPFVLAVALASDCADMGSLGGTKYGETSGTVAGQTDRTGKITSVEIIKIDEDYKLGVGTAVGTVGASVARLFVAFAIREGRQKGQAIPSAAW